MNMIAQYGKEIFALFVPLFTLLINKYFKNSTKLTFGTLHQFGYLINEALLDENGEEVNKKMLFIRSHFFL